MLFMCVLLFNRGKVDTIALFGEASGSGDPGRPGVGFHLSHSSQLSNECEQVILLSELSVVLLGF